MSADAGLCGTNAISFRDSAHFPPAKRHQVAAVEPDPARSPAALEIQQPEQGECETAFSRSAGADQPHDLTGANVERRVFEHSGPTGIIDAQPNVEQRTSGHFDPPGARANISMFQTTLGRSTLGLAFCNAGDTATRAFLVTRYRKGTSCEMICCTLSK